MSDALPDATLDPASLLKRPKRADARRNYDKVLAAARDAFGRDGADASLEEIARQAEVGIATLYRNFPTRADLLEATYVEEVVAMAQTAADVADLEPWDALVAWLTRYRTFTATKRAVGEALVAYIDADSDVFRLCRTALVAAGEPLVQRAQAAGVVRPDASFIDIARMVGGLAVIRNAGDDELDRIMGIALDGLRVRPPA